MNSLNIIISVYAALIATTGAHGESLECPKICPDIFEPICVTDGHEYVKFDNHCEMSVFNCKRQHSNLSAFFNIDMDWCTTTEMKDNFAMSFENLQESEVSCIKPCPMILRPVCGSNGTYRKTFSNDCEMKMFNCLNKIQKKNGWRILKKSSCSI